tara:strand:- start:672 stop:899 length:228 start_codon:yes stop_codon:yes gene_type:complete
VKEPEDFKSKGKSKSKSKSKGPFDDMEDTMDEDGSVSLGWDVYDKDKKTSASNVNGDVKGKQGKLKKLKQKCVIS